MIVVTTPTGSIGKQVVAELLSRGERVRAIARDASKLPADVRERAEVIEGSHGDAAVVGRAFEGASAVFWVVPPNPRAPSLEAAYLDFTRPACEAIRASGVPRVVSVSALGRGTKWQDSAGLVTASLRMDDLLAESGAAHRALACPSFMENLLRQAKSIRKEGVFRAPQSPDKPRPTCATGDIAAAGVRLLVDPSWTGRGEVPVLGPEDLSPDQQAAILSDVLGRPVRYEATPIDAFGAQLKSMGTGEAFVRGYVEMMRAKNEGMDNATPRTPEASSPTTFRAWCERVMKPALNA